MRRKTKKPVAIHASDFHFSHQAPSAREEVGDEWYESMSQYCWQLTRLSKRFNNAVILGTGDFFHDGWRSAKCPPQLINFLIDVMPVIYGIPGQHDLPYHRYKDISRSAFWTLVQAGKICNVPPYEINRRRFIGPPNHPIFLYGFPWGYKVRPPTLVDKESGGLHICMAHRYIWTSGKKHVEASNSDHYESVLPSLKGYDLALFGDNHMGFHLKNTTPPIINGGTFLRRMSNEKSYKPFVTVIYDDASFQKVELDSKEDKFATNVKSLLDKEDELVMESMIKSLNELKGTKGSDFTFACKKEMERLKVSYDTRNFILKALEAT